MKYGYRVRGDLLISTYAQTTRIEVLATRAADQVANGCGTIADHFAFDSLAEPGLGRRADLYMRTAHERLSKHSQPAHTALGSS